MMAQPGGYREVLQEEACSDPELCEGGSLGPEQKSCRKFRLVAAASSVGLVALLALAVVTGRSTGLLSSALSSVEDKQVTNPSQNPKFWLKAANFNVQTNTWTNSGWGPAEKNGVVTAGSVQKLKENGLDFLKGSSATEIYLGNIVPMTFTICSLTRYAGPTKGRILSGANSWFHGHLKGKTGVAYYGSWRTKDADNAQAGEGWVAMCSKNSGGGNSVMVNGKAIGQGSGGTKPPELSINRNRYPWDDSDFAIAELLIYNVHKSDQDMADLHNMLLKRVMGPQPVTFQSQPQTWLHAADYDVTADRWTNRGTGPAIDNLVQAGSVTKVDESGHGAAVAVPSVKGTYATQLDFGDIVSSTFTICSTTRYTNTDFTYMKRILAGKGHNWLHGHWAGRAGAAYYGGAVWNTDHTINDRIMPRQNWLVMCGTSGGTAPSNFKINGGANIGTNVDARKPTALAVNMWRGSESGDFAISEIAIWNKVLSDAEMTKAVSVLESHLSQGLPAEPDPEAPALATIRLTTTTRFVPTTLMPYGMNGQWPVGWFRAGQFDTYHNSWGNRGGGSTIQNFVVEDTAPVTKAYESGYGASVKIASLKGTTATQLEFGPIMPHTYTICSLTRYTSTDWNKQKRILASEDGRKNWLHGHHAARAGVAYYNNGWKSAATNRVSPNTNWVAMCGTNDPAVQAPYNVMVNGNFVGTSTGGQDPSGLTVNKFASEKSDFAIAEVIIWYGGLSKTAMESAMGELMKRLTG